MNISTNRLIIRDFRISDLKDLQEILGDTETMKFCEHAYTLEQTQNFLQNFCIAKKGAFAVVVKDSLKVIGYLLFNAVEPAVYEIGFIFNKKNWRQGYAYEACSNIIEYAFEHLDVRKIVAETIDTQKSVGLMKKLGMTFLESQKNATQDVCGNPADMHLYEINRNG